MKNIMFLDECTRDDITCERACEIIVFRADSSGRAVGGFPHSRFRSVGSSVYSGEFSGGRRDYLATMLAGYSRSPFLLAAESGSAIAVRSMVAEANLCVAAIFPESVKRMSAIAMAGGLDLVVLPPGAAAGETDGLKNDHDDLIRRAYQLLCGGFYSIDPELSHEKGREIIVKSASAAKCLAIIAGCMCSFEDNTVLNGGRLLKPSRHFCGDLFSAFAFLSLLACGRCSLRREAEMLFTVVDGEFIVEISCDIYVKSSGAMPEVEECRKIADRKKLFYEASVIDKGKGTSTLKIRFSPVRYDWSMLGLKSFLPFGLL